MFQRLRSLKTGNRHQDEFLARYDEVLKWAKQLSANRPWQAEDLAQDAYLQFMAIRPDLDDIQNLNAYLYAIVRNLHRSMLHRHLRLRQVPLSILDFDRAEDGLKLIDKEHEHGVLEDLESIRVFACQRRETSKIGSLLIIRFFYGYSVEEAALLMGINRTALDSRLLRARKEAREYLAERKGRVSGKVLPLPSEVPASLAKEPILSEHSLADPIEILRERIFESPKGQCIPPARMKALYAELSSSGIDTQLLAHIVCCRACLDLAARSAGLDQNPPDEPHSGSKVSAEQSKSRAAKLQKVREWDRQFKRLLEHRPEQLRVTVNGMPLVSQPVVAGRSELTVSIPLAERLEFVEVLSEQEVRLLMLPVLAVPPEGEYEQTGELDFRDGRTLSIKLTFDDPWPTVYVHYREPQFAHAPDAESPKLAPVEGAHRGVTKTEALQRLLRWIWTPATWLSPRILSGAVALLLIGVLLFVQTRETTANAAALVGRMDAWERAAVQPGSVLHRTFDFIERNKRSPHIVRRSVEVWRRPDAGMKISKLIDDSGAVIASARIGVTLPALTSSDAWQFEPAADTYRALVHELGIVRVSSSAGEYALADSFVSLKLDAKTYAPKYETIETPDSIFEFRERATESEPERFSPFAPEPPAVRAALRVAPRFPVVEPTSSPTPISKADLDASEVGARVALHRMNADLGEQIRIHRREQEIEVTGILDSSERKGQIEAVLKDLPHVRTSLLSPDDFAASPDANARIAAALQTPPQAPRMSPALLTPWLEQRYSRESDRLAYVNRISDLARQCLGHAHALKELVDRYGLLSASPVNSASVHSIAVDHIAALQKDWSELNELVAPAVGSDSSDRTASAAAGAESNGAKLLESLGDLNRCLLRLFAEHSSLQEPEGPEREIQTYWNLRHDAATSLAALSTK